MMQSRAYWWLAALLVLAGGGCSDDQSPEAPGNPPPPPAAEGRLLEEGDIVRLEGNRLFVLSATRGLLAVALDDPASPRLLATVQFPGKPVELYYRAGWVLALVSDRLFSAVVLVDVRDPAAPRPAVRFDIRGPLDDSRLVGDVLYVVSGGGRVIQSIDVSDPAEPRAVDLLTFPAGGSDNHVHTTDRIFYITSNPGQPLGECSTQYQWNGCTLVSAIDVSSPTGQLRRGASYFVGGRLLDRYSIDHHGGVLRVMLGPRWGQSGIPAVLRTFQAADAHQLEPLAQLPIRTERPESITAVRFDGPRAFLVTFARIDPLFTLDLSRPEAPRLTGHLETPGWVDYIVPRGDRLIGVGHDQAEFTAGGARTAAGWQLHVSIYNVANLADPHLLDRKLFGEGWDQSLPDERDDVGKVVRVIDPLSLILVPFNRTSYWGRMQGKVQLFRFSKDQLAPGGLIAHPALIRRALPLGDRHVVTVSDRTVEVVDVTDLSLPKVVGRLPETAALRTFRIGQPEGGR
jgi:hypothetical protein